MADLDNTKLGLAGVALAGAGALGGYHLEPNPPITANPCDCELEILHRLEHQELKFMLKAANSKGEDCGNN